MNNTNLLKMTFLILLTVMTPLFTSCSDEKIETPKEDPVKEELGKYTKQILVYDATKSNSIELLVGSDDPSVLKLWNSSSFSLEKKEKGQKLATMNWEPLQNQSKTSDSDDDEMVAAEIAYTVIAKHYENPTDVFVLVENPPYQAASRGWLYSTFYSHAIEDQTVTVNVYGRNFWKKGYYSVSYKKNSGSSWSSIAGEWTRIKNNEEKNYTRTPCYVMKARRKYKGTNNSVVIEFEY